MLKPPPPPPENERALIEWLLRYGRDFEPVREIYRSNLDRVVKLFADEAQKELSGHNSLEALRARSDKIKDIFSDLLPSLDFNILNILHLEPTKQGYYMQVYVKMTLLDYFLLYKYKDKLQVTMSKEEGVSLEDLYDAKMDIALTQEELGSVPFSPNLPDVTKAKPIKAYSAGSYMLLLLRDVDPIGGAGFIKYLFVLVLISRKTNRPTCFVTLETSPLASNTLCVFQPDGTRLNLGPLNGTDLSKAFIIEGLKFLKRQFHLQTIEDLAEQPKPKSWWKW